MKKLIIALLSFGFLFGQINAQNAKTAVKPQKRLTKTESPVNKPEAKPAAKPNDAKELAATQLNKLKTALRLDGQQQQKVYNILLSTNQKIETIKLRRANEEMKKMMIKQAKSERDTAIRAILNEDQIAKYNQIMTTDKGGPVEKKVERQIERLDEIVSLDMTQRTKATDIIVSSQKRIDALVKETPKGTRPDVDAVEQIKSERRTEIKSILRGPQIQKFEEANKKLDRSQDGPAAKNATALTKRIKDELSLNAEQEKEVYDINLMAEKRINRVDEVGGGDIEEIIKIHNFREKSIIKVLNPEQVSKFQKLSSSMKKDIVRGQKAKNKKMKPSRSAPSERSQNTGQ